MIKLITFDLDDTLWDNTPVLVKAEQELWKVLCELWPKVHDIASPNDMFKCRVKLAEKQPDLKPNVTELRRRSIVSLLAQCKCPTKQADKIAAEAMLHFMEWRHKVKCFPEVSPVLTLLSKQYTLGAITNGNIDVNRLEIGEFFTFSFCAGELGTAKPEPGLFQKALATAEVTAAETLHVGDGLSTDIAGANALGIKSVWFNPNDIALEGDIIPDYTIRSLTGLVRILMVPDEPKVAETAETTA